MCKKKNQYLFILFLFIGFLYSFSNEKSFDRIDMSTGLSHNSAICLIEDQDGFIWIGTRDGLNKYDGANFQVFKHAFFDSTSLVNNQVNCLLETINQEIWIGTANGLCMYNSETNKFATFSLLSAHHSSNSYYIRSICETENGFLYVGSTNGLYLIERESKSFKFMLVEPDSEALSNNVRKIFQDSNGNIWLGTANGLYKKHENKFEKYVCGTDSCISNYVIRDIAEDKSGLLWVGTEGHGIHVINKYEVKTEFILNTEKGILPSNIVRSIFLEDEPYVWIGTTGGLCIYNRETQKYSKYSGSVLAAGGIGNNSIHDIIQDENGGIWLAIYLGGVNYYHPRKNMFKHHQWNAEDNKYRIGAISALLEDDEGNLWIGEEDGGLYKSVDEGNSISEDIELPLFPSGQNNIKSLALGGNKIWIGRLNGLFSIDLSSKEIESYFHQPGNSNFLNAGHVHALLNENNEKLWIGTNGGGVQILNPQNSTFRNIQELGNLHINCFFLDSRNRIWVGSEERLNLLDNEKIVDLSESIINWNDQITDVTFISEDSNNNLWFGTLGNGLFYLKENRIFWFNTSKGLIDNTVNSFLEGDKNQYWITTNKGLSKISVVEENDGTLELISQTFSVNQGIQGLQFLPNSAVKLKSGKLFFGGVNGLNSFKHSEIAEGDDYSKLVFTELRVDYKTMQVGDENSPLKKSLNETSELVLAYNQRDFSISFTGINFINPDKNNYRYMVSGIDDSWVEMDGENEINFTYFPVGTYEIKVQVSTNPEKWDDKFRSLTVTVLPPWWKTWWAFLIYGMLLIGLLVLFFSFSQRWAKMKNQLVMQQFQNEKENELHQLKLKFYTDVSHELRTPLTLILAPLENLISKTEIPNRFRNQLVQIQRSGFRLMQLVNQILDLRKLETGHEHLQVAEGNIIRFFSEISLAFKEVAASKKIEFEYIPHKNEQRLWYDRNKLEIIINNLLSNAFKHTPSGGKVELRLKEITGKDFEKELPDIKRELPYLQISVVDNGAGITAEDLNNIFDRYYSKNEKRSKYLPGAGVGLELTRRMVELHKGGILVTSIGSEGGKKETSFSVLLCLDDCVYLNEELDLKYRNSEDPSLYTSEFLQRETLIAANEVEQEEGNRTTSEEFERLLIVEDNHEVRSFIKELFADDYEISEAENGKIAFEKAIETNPQLIISDIMMPVMDGIELCRIIKTDPRTSHIPVVLLTARTALTFKYEGLETGADDYITKPFSAKFLSLRVKNLIQQRKTIQEHFKREVICDPGSITVTSVDEKILKKAVDYITKNITDPSINVNKISEHVGLSRVHFYRKIKAITNQTAVEFIRSIKLKRAASLLSQDKLSIKEVRNMVGFDDADYFRECFKEQFGVNPSDYASLTSKSD